MMKTIHLLALAAFLALSAAAPAAAQQHQTVTYKVEAGETLFGIAEKYGVTVRQLKEWNDLAGNRLSVGQELVIRRQAGPTEQGAAALTHTVQPKETLYSISRKYGVAIGDIRRWNNLEGQTLPVGSELTIHPADRADESPADVDSRAQSYYTVKSGDSLFRIAELHNMTVSRLKELNSLSSNTIQVGQRLVIQPTDQPPSLSLPGVESSAQGNFMLYTLEESQSREELLKTFRMDEAEFRALNPGRTTHSFRRGEQVVVLAPPTESFTNPYEVNSTMHSLGTIPAQKYETQAIATTTSGELYNPEALTAAHPSMAMGSVIFVENRRGSRGVLVRINDRTAGSRMKLSEAAWNILNLTGNTAPVTLYRENE